MADVRAVLDLARARGLRIATAESCTAGMIASALTDVTGSSSVVECGFVTYSNNSKINLLDVSSDTLNTKGAVSEGVALEMAQGALKASAADLALSVTGIAGPGGSEHKPEGRVCFALAQNGMQTQTYTVEFGPLGRQQVRQAATQYGIDLIWAHLSKL